MGQFIVYTLLVVVAIVVGLIIATILIAIARRIRPEGASSGSVLGIVIGRGLQVFGVLLLLYSGTVVDEKKQFATAIGAGITAISLGGHIAKAAREP